MIQTIAIQRYIWMPAFESMVYALPITKNHNNYNIVHLELLNIVVALKVWTVHWSNRRIKIHCDNMVAVEELQKGRARDATLALMVRHVWLICALFNIQILVCHIPGKDNTLADLLSSFLKKLYSYARTGLQKHIVANKIYSPFWVL